MSTTLVQLSTLVDDVALQLPGCPRALAVDGLRWAARRLCRESGAWLEQVAVTTVAGTTSYTPTTPTGARVEAVSRILDSNGDVALDPAAYEWREDGTLILEDDPGVQTLTVELVCSPSGAQVPDWLAAGWADGLKAGAVAQRMSDQAKPWSDPQTAAIYRAEFSHALVRLRQRRWGNGAGRTATALQGVQVL